MDNFDPQRDNPVFYQQAYEHEQKERARRRAEEEAFREERRLRKKERRLRSQNSRSSKTRASSLGCISLLIKATIFIIFLGAIGSIISDSNSSKKPYVFPEDSTDFNFDK